MTGMASKGRVVGMAGDTLWLIAVSTGFAILSLACIETSAATGALAAVVGLAALFLGVTLRAMLAARRIADDPPARTGERKIMMRRFTLIAAAVWLTAAANVREIFQMTHGVDAR